MSLEDPYEGQKFSSFEVLKKYLEEYGRKNFVKFWIRSSHRIGSLKSKSTRKVNPNLKYVCMKFACIFGGEKIRCRGSGIRRSSTFRNLGCPCTINAVVGEDGNHVKLETVVLEHNHLLSKSLFEARKKSKNKSEMVGADIAVNNNSLSNRNTSNKDLIVVNGKATANVEGDLLSKETKEEESGADDGCGDRSEKLASNEQNNIQEYFKQIQQKYGSNIKIIVVNREESEKVRVGEDEERVKARKERSSCDVTEEDDDAECSENIDELEKLSMSAEKEVCRLCLSASNKLTPIFKPSLPLESTILSFKIMSCASIEISNNDELPCSICSTCEEILDIAYNFRMRCENSDSILRKFYSSNRLINVNGLSDSYAHQKEAAEEVKCEEAEEESGTEQKDAEYPEVAKGEGEAVAGLPGEAENVAATEIYVKFSETCPICESSFESYPEMLEHLKEHSDAENYLLTCNLCNVIFTTVKALLEHLSEHVDVNVDWTKRLIACGQCDMTFLTEDDAKAHGECHAAMEETGTKNSGSGYLCNICGKILKSKDRFQSHRNTHEGLRPHICFKCGRGFADRKNMHQHYDIVHLRKAKHECPICHKKFYAPTKMKSHITMHYGVKPFACDVCNKTFRLRMNMIKHKKTHSNERPHKCDKCSAAFIDKNLLTRHSYVHGGVRPYVCPYCAHRFTLKFNLKKHMSSGRCSGKGKAKEANCEFPMNEWGSQTEDAVLPENKCDLSREVGERSHFPEGNATMKTDMLQEYGGRQ